MTLRSRYCLMLTMVLLATACSKDTSEPIPSEEPNQDGGVEVILDLEATASDELKAASFELVGSDPVLKMTEEDMASTVIFLSTDKTKYHYARITWKKTRGKNHLYFKGKAQQTNGQPLTLDTSKEWYMMGYLGGEYKSNAGGFGSGYDGVYFDPNGRALKAFDRNQSLTKAVPIYFSWTKVHLSRNGSTTFGTAGTRDAQELIKFRTVGTLMRVELTNEMNYDVRYRSITYSSNVLSTRGGYFPLWKTELEKSFPNGDPLATWRPDNTAEPKYTFQNNNGTTLDLIVKKNSTYDKSFLVWGMRQQPTTDSRTITHILADASRLADNRERTEMTYPNMKNIYIWGSTKMPREHVRLTQKTRLVREKLALEYFDEHYLQPGWHTDVRASDYYRMGSAGAIPLFKHSEINKRDQFLRETSRKEWKVPGEFDLSAWVTPQAEAPYLLFSGNRTIEVEKPARINGVLKDYKHIYRTGNTIYAIRLDDGPTNGRKQYSAWRYWKYDRDARGRVGTITECVFLGPNYKGNIDDIMKPEFWTRHKDDIIRRDYDEAYSKAIGVANEDYYRAYTVAHAAIDTNPNFSDGRHRFAWILGYQHSEGFGIYYLRHFERYNRDTPVDFIAPVILLERDGTGWRNNNGNF